MSGAATATEARLVAPTDPRWRTLVDTCASDVYHLPGYLDACATVEEGQPVVALVDLPEAQVGVPLFLRPLPDGQGRRDASTPYGYPCPIGTARSEAQWTAAWRALAGLLRDEGVIAAFFRLHPLLTEAACRDGATAAGAVIVGHGETIHLRLDQDEAALWSETRPRFRSNINKLAREGWTFVADDWSLLPAFEDIYAATMRRADAAPFYFFPPVYFATLRDRLGPVATLHTVLDPDGVPAASAIFTRQGPLVQYHLGGTSDAHAAIAPAKLLFHEARLWFRARGATRLHLGGGLGGREDSLYRFKSGFSKRTTGFHTCRLICDGDRYADQLAAWEGRCGVPAPPIDGFFPPYRAPCPTPSDR